MSKATIVCVCFIAACATGGSNGGGNDEPADAAVVVQHDASNVITSDAPRADAGVTQQDAQVSQLPDASTGGGLFCATNGDCTVAGECCVNLGGPQGFCAPGTVVLGQCFPE